MGRAAAIWPDLESCLPHREGASVSDFKNVSRRSKATVKTEWPLSKLTPSCASRLWLRLPCPAPQLALALAASSGPGPACRIYLKLPFTTRAKGWGDHNLKITPTGLALFCANGMRPARLRPRAYYTTYNSETALLPTQSYRSVYDIVYSVLGDHHAALGLCLGTSHSLLCTATLEYRSK